jgi:hypothetical protein
MAQAEFDESIIKRIGKINADTKWTPIQKKHMESLAKDYRFYGSDFHNGVVNPLGIPTSFVSGLDGPPLPRNKLWWLEGFQPRDRDKYDENCKMFERLTGRQVVFNKPSDDMLDVFRTVKKPLFLVNHESLVQGVVNVLVGAGRLVGGQTNVHYMLDFTKGCVVSQKAPNGGTTSRSGKSTSGYVVFRCDNSSDIPLTHALIGLVYGVEALIPVYTGAYEVSHLCHNSLCCNIDHLLIETAYANRKMREGCQGYAGNECRCKPWRCVETKFDINDYKTIEIGRHVIKIPPHSISNCLRAIPTIKDWMKILDIGCKLSHHQPNRVDPAISVTTGKGE